MGEIGWATLVTDDAVQFRSLASQRIIELCAISERNRLKYEYWLLSAPGIVTYVSQANVVEELPAE